MVGQRQNNDPASNFARMFSTCLFCHASLGANQSIEHFPVGKRLAFDSERGRLWAVCPKCARWNLTPIEERWEALEECERAYRDTRKRVSTDNIALARLRDGTDLIRIGQPLRPEFAAWRYERVLRKRRWQMFRPNWLGLGTVALGAPLMLPAIGAAPWAVFGGQLLYVSGFAGRAYLDMRELYWKRQLLVPLGSGQHTRLTFLQMFSTTCIVGDDGQLRVGITHGGERQRMRKALVDEQQTELVGDPAQAALRAVIVGVNFAGASRSDVSDALHVIDAATDSSAHRTPSSAVAAEHQLNSLVRMLAEHRPEERREPHNGLLSALFERHRLALEMVVHEDDERRAMSGELGALYARWEEAERIAKIADGELTLLANKIDESTDGALSSRSGHTAE